MTDDECVRFLQWALPRLHLSWRGFRRVRRQVCRRVERRCRGLGLPDLAAYRDYLEERPEADCGELRDLRFSGFRRSDDRRLR